MKKPSLILGIILTLCFNSWFSLFAAGDGLYDSGGGSPSTSSSSSGGSGSGTVSAGSATQLGIYSGGTTIVPSSIATDNSSTFTIVGVLVVSSGTTGSIATGSNTLGLFTSSTTAAATFNTSSTTFNNASVFLQSNGIYGTGNQLFFGNTSGTNLGDFSTSSMTITGAVTGTAIALRSTAADSSTSGRTLNMIQDDGATGSSARLGLIAFTGNNNNNALVSCGGISARASQTWTSAANGTELNFSVCGSGSASLNPFFGMLATSATTGRFHINSTNGAGSFVGSSTINIATSTASTAVFSILGATTSVPTGTHNQYTQGVVTSTGGPLLIFSSNTVTATTDWMNFMMSGGSPVTLTGCGTTPTIVSNGKFGFSVTVGGSGTGCVAIFPGINVQAPSCSLTPRTGSIVNTLNYQVTASSISWQQTGAAGNTYDVTCYGLSTQ